jgi:putative redox protein
MPNTFGKADTNFSANVDDLQYAASWMSDHGMPPTLLIGHSLGGAAVLAAAASIPGAKAVVTIGAPSRPSHVERLFEHAADEIEAEGRAQVDLGGRPFTISKQFV